jgi:hypothetical protein
VLRATSASPRTVSPCSSCTRPISLVTTPCTDDVGDFDLGCGVFASLASLSPSLVVLALAGT